MSATVRAVITTRHRIVDGEPCIDAATTRANLTIFRDQLIACDDTVEVA